MISLTFFLLIYSLIRYLSYLFYVLKLAFPFLTGIVPFFVLAVVLADFTRAVILFACIDKVSYHLLTSILDKLVIVVVTI